MVSIEMSKKNLKDNKYFIVEYSIYVAITCIFQARDKVKSIMKKNLSLELKNPVNNNIIVCCCCTVGTMDL